MAGLRYIILREMLPNRNSFGLKTERKIFVHLTDQLNNHQYFMLDCVVFLTF